MVTISFDRRQLIAAAVFLMAGAILFLVLALAATSTVAILVFAVCCGVFIGAQIGIIVCLDVL